MVYFVHDPPWGRIKIGFSRDPDSRIEQLRKIHGRGLVVLGIAGGGFDDEKHYHEMFREFRHQGEWFRDDPRLLEAVRLLCSNGIDPSDVREHVLGIPPPLSPCAERVLRWLKADRVETFSARDVIRRFRSLDELGRNDVLDELANQGYIAFREKVRKSAFSGGRPSRIYAVNPERLGILDRQPTGSPAS